MPERQERDVLLAPLHTADMCTIHAHALGDSFLAEAGLHPKSAKIFPEHLSNIHPQDGHQSRILALRIIIRGALAEPASPTEPSRARRPSFASILRQHGKPRDDHAIPVRPPQSLKPRRPLPQMTDYDRAHLPTYLRLLDATSEGAPWEEVARDRARSRPRAGTGPCPARSRNAPGARPLAHRARLPRSASLGALTAAFNGRRVSLSSDACSRICGFPENRRSGLGMAQCRRALSTTARSNATDQISTSPRHPVSPRKETCTCRTEDWRSPRRLSIRRHDGRPRASPGSSCAATPTIGPPSNPHQLKPITGPTVPRRRWGLRFPG